MMWRSETCVFVAIDLCGNFSSNMPLTASVLAGGRAGGMSKIFETNWWWIRVEHGTKRVKVVFDSLEVAKNGVVDQSYDRDYNN